MALYQRIFSIIPSKNYEALELDAYYPGYFFGFHDKNPWSHDNSKLLAHQFDTNKSDTQLEASSINVGYFQNDVYKIIGSTKAWNWQQGATLQWIGNKNKVVYNDIEHGNCVAKIVDLDAKAREVIPKPVMAVSNNGKYALSCSFTRLGKGMPGYGYYQFSNTSENDLLPDNEGLSIIDLKDNSIKCIITLKDIAKIESNNLIGNEYHFFSHCLFSPKSNRFIFFHRFLRKNGILETRMFSSDINGKNIWQFTGEKFSHIAWFNDTTVLAYCKPANQEIGFYFFEEFTSNITGLDNEDLTSDGHPQVSSDGKFILIDTYPDRYRNQRLKLYDVNKNYCNLLVKYKIPFKFRQERRCDFHPRWNNNHTMICFDSAHKNVRSLCVIRNPMYEV